MKEETGEEEEQGDEMCKEFQLEETKSFHIVEQVEVRQESL